MTGRYSVPLSELEASGHVPEAEQITEQAERRLHAPLLDGPAVHPFGDGTTGADGCDGGGE